MDQDGAQTPYLDYLLAAASDRIGMRLSQCLRKRGVPVEFWRILSCLQDRQGLTMGDLAEQALLSLPTATRLVDKMVSEALVYRVPSPDDRRKVLVFRSDKGRDLWTQIKADADDLNRQIVETLGEEWVGDLVSKLGRLMQESDEFKGASPKL